MTTVDEDSGPNAILSQWILSQFSDGYRGVAIDVGAADGYSVNTTFWLEAEHGWRVLCIEPNPHWHEKLLTNRGLVLTCACDVESKELADFHVHVDCPEAYSSLRPTTNHEVWRPEENARWEIVQVPVKTLEECVALADLPQVDALCVDTEGTELDVLKSMDLGKWQPRVVIVESWDEGGMDEYLSRFGYRRELRRIVNDCYVLRNS